MSVNTYKPCQCKSSDGLFISRRHVSLVAAGVVFCFGGLFTLGYFYAQHDMNNKMYAQVSRNAFTDSMYETLCSLQNQEHAKEIHTQSNDVVTHDAVTLGRAYCAELIGFGTRKAAEAFISRIDDPLEIRHRSSVTPKGKKITWYQVVTKDYADRDELIAMVDRIAKQEKIKGTRIITRS